MKKLFTTIAATTVMASLIFSGCSSDKEKESEQSPEQSSETAKQTEDDGEKIKLNVVTAGGGFWETPMQEVEAAYEASHPDVDLNLEIYGYDQLFQVIEVKVASGSDEYDVIAVDAPLVAAYAERGYILPLDEYFPKDVQTQFIQSSQDASIWNDKFMAAPMETSAQLLFYNKALLEQAGVTYESDNEYDRVTWEDLVDMSNKVLDVVDPDRTQGYAGIALEQVSRPYQVLPLVNTLGEKGIADDGFTVDGVINTAGWEKAMQFYYDLFDKKLSLRGTKPEELGPMFFAGKSVFYIGGPWNFFTASATEGFDFGVAAFPTFAGYEDKTATPTGSWHLGLSAYSKKQAEAAEFIQWITSGEGNDVWIKASGNVPAKKATLDEILADSEAMETYKMSAYDALNTGFARPVSPGYTEWESIMSTTFEDIRNGTQPKDALNSAVDQINQIFKKYKD